MDYCKYHKNDEFTNVIFSDECYFELNRNSKKIFVLKDHEAPNKLWFNPNIKVGVWGAISKKGKIALVFCEKTITKEYYIEILKDHLLENANKLYGKNKWRFQQDMLLLTKHL